MFYRRNGVKTASSDSKQIDARLQRHEQISDLITQRVLHAPFNTLPTLSSPQPNPLVEEGVGEWRGVRAIIGFGFSEHERSN